MFSVTLTITAQEPLIITDGSAEGMAHQTLEYIPGNMLLGAFASSWVARKGKAGASNDDNPLFRALFLDGTTEWGNAYPCLGNDACVPVPNSFAKLKNHQGLPVWNEPATSAPLIINKLHLKQHPEEGQLADLCAGHNPPVADASPRLAHIGASFMEPRTRQVPGQPVQWNMHVALDADSRSAAEGQLFGFSSLAAGSAFQAEIFFHTKEALEEAQELFTTVKKLRVGHSRSAGYGLVGLRYAKEQEVTPLSAVRGKTLVHLVSDYIPKNSWQSPLESLLAELAQAAHVELSALSSDCTPMASYGTVAGFNGLWRLPKTSRAKMEKGSVVEVSLPVDASFPPSLGGATTEGYGRIRINPEYLARATVSCILPTTVQENPAPPAFDRNTPLLGIMRRRGLKRLAGEMALDTVMNDSGIAWFINKFDNKLGQSQRNNVRRLVGETPSGEWPAFFTSMAKTTRNRWENSHSQHPAKKYDDSLYVIMQWFVSQDFKEEWITRELTKVSLLGGPLSTDEQAQFVEMFHKEFLLHLLKTWEKAANNKGGGDD